MTDRRDEEAPSGLYLHVPFCDGKCPYCAFYSVPYAEAQARRWLTAIQREYSLFRAEGGPVPWRTLYIGGGTPSLLSEAILNALLEWVRDITQGGSVEEWSVEANPGSVTPAKLRAMRQAGVNRISLGVQSLDDARLRWLGRRHTAAEAEEAYAMARNEGFSNIGVDLIAGGPLCGPGRWARTLERVITWGPEHLSVYALTVEEGSALARRRGQRWRRGWGEGALVARLHEAAERLAQAGYERYEISNYARPGMACRHHIACWRGERYLGLGPAASSHVGMRRWTTAADLEDYLCRLEAGQPPARSVEVLTAETKATERLIFGLRMTAGVDLCDAAAGEGAEARIARWRAVLDQLARRGLVEGGPNRWRLTPRGLDFADSVAVELLP